MIDLETLRKLLQMQRSQHVELSFGYFVHKEVKEAAKRLWPALEVDDGDLRGEGRFVAYLGVDQLFNLVQVGNFAIEHLYLIQFQHFCPNREKHIDSLLRLLFSADAFLVAQRMHIV